MKFFMDGKVKEIRLVTNSRLSIYRQTNKKIAVMPAIEYIK